MGSASACLGVHAIRMQMNQEIPRMSSKQKATCMTPYKVRTTPSRPQRTVVGMNLKLTQARLLCSFSIPWLVDWHDTRRLHNYYSVRIVHAFIHMPYAYTDIHNIHTSVHPYIRTSVHPYIHASIPPSLTPCPRNFLPTCVATYIHPSVCPSICIHAQARLSRPNLSLGFL